MEISELDAFALRVLCLRASQGLTSSYPETLAEREFASRWRGSASPEEREAALERAMNYFVGGALQGVIDSLQRQADRRRRPASATKRRRWREI